MHILTIFSLARFARTLLQIPTMNKKAIFIFTICSIFLFSCKEDSSVKVADNVLDIAMLKEPTMLNPLLTPGSTERIVFHNIFAPMADFDPDTYELSPILIKAIPDGEPITDGPYKGGTQYTVEIKEEAKWDNGSPITAKDVVFTLKAIKHPNTNAAGYRSYMQWVSDVKVDPKNPKKATFYFKDYYILAKELAVTVEIYPQYHYDSENAMAEISIPEMDSEKAKDLIDANPKLGAFAKAFNSVKFTRESISGAGPYRLKEWISNQYITLEKKKNYWAKDTNIPSLMAKPDELKFHFIADETATISQMKEGNIDVFANMSGNTFFDLKENETYKDDFQYFTPELMKLYYIAINNSKPELSDPDVRRALAKLVDIPKLINILEGGLGRQTVGSINEKKGYYNNDLTPIAFDIEGAKVILSNEGWKDTNNDGVIDKKINGNKIEMDLDIHITGSELSKNIGLLMQENAKKVNIKINIITKKWSDTKRENLKKRDYDLIPSVLGQDLALDDPYSKWHSENDDPAKSNDVSYRSDKADDLINKIRSTQDDDQRSQYYKDLQKVMYDDQPVIFLYNPQEKIIVSKKWKASSTMKRPGYFAGTFELMQ
ncbi:MAG: peptide/nickel transport system substrate-binding protein [Saprospiraceae bacterium]|jgi:peptide/nickel transport system substrate-binding protein